MTSWIMKLKNSLGEIEKNWYKLRVNKKWWEWIWNGGIIGFASVFFMLFIVHVLQLNFRCNQIYSVQRRVCLINLKKKVCLKGFRWEKYIEKWGSLEQRCTKSFSQNPWKRYLWGKILLKLQMMQPGFPKPDFFANIFEEIWP